MESQGKTSLGRHGTDTVQLHIEPHIHFSVVTFNDFLAAPAQLLPQTRYWYCIASADNSLSSYLTSLTRRNVTHGQRYFFCHQFRLDYVGVSNIRTGRNTHKLFRPAIRGCKAQLPPTTAICFPSMKSAGRLVSSRPRSCS